MSDIAPSQTPGARHQAAWRARHPKPPPEPLPSTDEATKAALTAARGSRRAAARALGISSSTILRRLAAEPLATWAKFTWPPQQPADRAVPVLRVETVPASKAARVRGERVYVLAAHGAYADGEHINRVPIDGSRPRAKVVCQRCKEEMERV